MRVYDEIAAAVSLFGSDTQHLGSVFGSHRHGCGRNRKDKVFQ